ncbi:hypothetical protein [Tuberibacillus sp. Marseille-P3662]|uniref:hypothetical protein n=1 Tax=Tuberibacillus sp. Marseille-P3662 TaxID=1965358 RepID=UPI000A1CD717|nr:hypothetical protein [Tuberibacillus sp. Marseille-P3662]
MDPKTLKSMRIKQVMITNGLLIALLTIVLTLFTMLRVTMVQMFVALAIIVLVQSLVRLLKGESTQSLIPIFEQVAIYEKQKMGREWRKQHRMGFISDFILSGVFLMEAYWSRGSTDVVMEMDSRFMLLMILFIIILMNIGLYIHIRKVDHSTSQADFKGYTLKTSLIGLMGGLAVGVVMIVGIVFYVLNLA